METNSKQDLLSCVEKDILNTASYERGEEITFDIHKSDIQQCCVTVNLSIL